MIKTLLTSALFLAASCSFADDSAMAAAGKQLFAHHCHACHSEDPSRNTFGPSLTGVYGRKAASLARFAYSDALKTSDIVWDEQSLRRWIAGNDQYVPGTRMRHVSITDAAEQDYLIAFLKSL